MQANVSRFDQLITRVLLIPSGDTLTQEDGTPLNASELQEEAHVAENVFGLSLFMSGVRCIIKYAVLPFVLPIVGITGAFGSVISIAINLAALAALIYSVRRFWQIDYKYKRQYLIVAVVTFALLVVFTYFDVVELFTGAVA